MEKLWQVIGYSENAINRPRTDSIGIMFEDQVDFEQIWWHYPKL